MKQELTVTQDMLRAFFALEENAAFQELMKIMHSRMQGMAEWSCLIKDPDDLRWAQGRVQEMSEWVGAWLQRREWATALESQKIADQKIREADLL